MKAAAILGIVFSLLTGGACPEEYKLQQKQRYDEQQKRAAAETICHRDYEEQQADSDAELKNCKEAHAEKVIANRKEYQKCVQEQVQKPIEYLEAQRQHLKDLPKSQEIKSTITVEDAFLIWFFFL
jgi:DNA gyrase/topoisomerase IV subunit A